MQAQHRSVLREVEEIKTALQKVGQQLFRVTDNLYRQIEAHSSLVQWLNPRLPLPPLRGWAMSPDSLLAIAALIKQNRYHAVVELGSGASTIALGYAVCGRRRGRVVSIDHNLEFAAATEQLVRLHELTDVVSVVHAPLTQVRVGADQQVWYDPETVLREAPRTFDLLLVDGPPGRLAPNVRYAAGAFLFDRLRRNGAVCLDDAFRPDERAVIERWSSEFKMSVTLVSTEKGLALLYPKARAAGGDHRRSTADKSP